MERQAQKENKTSYKINTIVKKKKKDQKLGNMVKIISNLDL